MGSITGSMLGSIIVTAGLEYLRIFDEPSELFGTAIPLFRPGFTVTFSVLLMAAIVPGVRVLWVLNNPCKS